DKLDLSIHLYPNPAHRNLTIQGLPSERFSVQLINLQGQILFAKEVFARENEKLELTLPELPEGLYSLSFENNQGARYTKMLMIGRQ
ncbi:MAG: T9SS type A sorting domain-containing protein, partial [Bacteroidetes bacterium]|nr:T9SS type A sorting domain-containing protein [Bacteroidota bacterium]